MYHHQFSQQFCYRKGRLPKPQQTRTGWPFFSVEVVAVPQLPHVPEAWTDPVHTLQVRNCQENSGACPPMAPHTSGPPNSGACPQVVANTSGPTNSGACPPVVAHTSGQWSMSSSCAPYFRTSKQWSMSSSGAPYFRTSKQWSLSSSGVPYLRTVEPVL